MSIIFKSGESISKSPLNTSLSKHMFSFSKGERFGKEINLKTSTEFVYNVPEKKNKRTTSFGFGKRSLDFEKKTIDTPFYDMPSTFSVKKNSKEINVQSFNRTCSESGSLYSTIAGSLKRERTKPYTSNSMVINSKFKNIMNKTDSSPGPGQYDIAGLRKDGKYPLSKNRTTNSLCFGKSDSKRFLYKDVNMDIPDPGFYKEDTIFNMKNGFNFNSRVKSNHCYSFGRRPDKKILPKKSACKYLLNEVPGPGDYHLPSDFGIYLSKSYKYDLKNDNSDSSGFKKKFAIFSGGFNSSNSFVLNK